ncbi:MAG: ubiquinol-cytochrome c reductase iron-sulfur subunit [Pirellulales bacterium]|nr:ubiquinol-cytochrome c reductase iron-sulfur subunit [Pirellulales bacterium]
MADKKKMSVADMLAAARKADGGGSSSADSAADATPAPPAPAEMAPASAGPAKPIPKPGAAGRPSAADILAMARAGRSAGATPAAEAPKPAPKPAAADKPAPAAKPKPAAAATSEPRDTASILAAARKKERPGPVSKAEVAGAAKPSPAAAAAKAKLAVPPMPQKPDYAKPKPAGKAAVAAAGQDRRGFLATGFWALGGVSALWSLLAVRFLFPNVLREPPSRFKVGFPDEYPTGLVTEKFKAQYGVWMVNTEYNGQPQIVALKTVCTHLGCTPNWLEAEQKYKCPCHGSGFYKDGINFEGPAPRPLERYAIRVADDGQIEVDKSRTFQEEMGQWSDPACFIPA